jgi:hypothetical protein
MKIKYFKWVIGVITLSFFILVACSSDKDNNKENSIKVYRGEPSDNNELQTNDTISIPLSSNCTLYIESSSDSLFVMSDDDNMEIECLDHNVYRCTPKCIGKTDVLILPFDFDDETPFKHVHFNVRSYSDRFNIIENTYSIDASSTVMEYTIKDDIESSYIPAKLSTLNFKYATSEKGDFSYKARYQTDSITGTFVTDGSEYQLSYGGVSQSISIEEKTEGGYTLTQDFTEEFKNKYPSSEIEKVVLSSTATGYKH